MLGKVAFLLDIGTAVVADHSRLVASGLIFPTSELLPLPSVDEEPVVCQMLFRRDFPEALVTGQSGAFHGSPFVNRVPVACQGCFR